MQRRDGFKIQGHHAGPRATTKDSLATSHLRTATSWKQCAPASQQRLLLALLLAAPSHGRFKIRSAALGITEIARAKRCRSQRRDRRFSLQSITEGRKAERRYHSTTLT